jgi:hypothetical protein
LNNVPARPFFRPAFDKNAQKLGAFIETTVGAVYLGKLAPRQALGLIGEFMVAKVKAEIRAVKSPPLAKLTIVRKGSTKPLIDTGQMINSVQHIEVYHHD